MVSTHLKNISQIGSFPQAGVKIKNIWNHHLEKYERSVLWQHVPSFCSWLLEVSLNHWTTPVIFRAKKNDDWKSPTVQPYLPRVFRGLRQRRYLSLKMANDSQSCMEGFFGEKITNFCIDFFSQWKPYSNKAQIPYHTLSFIQFPAGGSSCSWPQSQIEYVSHSIRWAWIVGINQFSTWVFYKWNVRFALETLWIKHVHEHLTPSTLKPCWILVFHQPEIRSFSEDSRHK